MAKISTTTLVNKIYTFCELYSGITFFPYQAQFAKRFIRSVLENDGAELTALFSRQSGKCFAKNTPILMFDGTIKKVQDIKVGDVLISPNSLPVVVTELVRGKERMFEVVSREKNHENFTVNISHTLTVIDRKQIVHNYTVDDYLKLPEWKRKDEYRGYRSAVDFEHKEVELEPYFLGLWLGDGSSYNQSITNMDNEVIEYIHDYANRLGFGVSYDKSKECISYLITNGNCTHKGHRNTYNPVLKYLKDYDLLTNKHIPLEYMCNSRQVRLEVLAGLIDSDGHRSLRDGKENVLEITFSNRKLASDVLQLIRSLGFRASIKTSRTNMGTYRQRINAYGDFSVVPTKVARKQYEKCPLRENPLTFEFDLIDKGIGEYYGFTIESDDHLFLLGDYTVVHNSETVATITGGLAIILPTLANTPMFINDLRLDMFKDGVYIGIYAPVLHQAQIIFNRLKTRMYSKHGQLVLSDPGIQVDFDTNNGQNIVLSNGSKISSKSASEGSNIEGDSYHIILVDEAQDVGDFKFSKCLAEDTEIWLANGSKKSIKEVVENRLSVLTMDGEKMPKKFYDNGVQPVYELTLANGRKIQATENHQFYVRRRVGNRVPKWDTVTNIEEGNAIAVPRQVGYFGDKYTFRQGLITGLMLGDGCFSANNPMFCCLPEVKKYIPYAIREFDVHYHESKYNEANELSEGYFKRNNRSGGSELVAFFKELGIWGLKGEDKTITDVIFNGSEPFLRGVVVGLIQTDGCVSTNEISFSSISESLVRGLQDILLKFGVPSRVSTRDNNGSYGKNPKPLWTCTIKSSEGVLAFSNSFKLFKQGQKKLDKLADKKSKKQSRKTVTDTRRGKFRKDIYFERVVSKELIGEKHTYCLEVEGRNFIANGIVSSNSISPMGAFYNATKVLIGTPSIDIGFFYHSIERNKRAYAQNKKKRDHFEYDCDIIMKYNPRYAKYIAGEKVRLGEESDEFQMSYKLKWILQRGMFITLDKLSELADPNSEMIYMDYSRNHVAGLDLGKAHDSTILTILEVDWDNPVIVERSKELEIPDFIVYNKKIKCWLELQGDNWEEQYPQIMDFLSNFRIAKLVIDATGLGSPIYDRIAANVDYEVIPFVLSRQSSSELMKHFDSELKSKRFSYPAGESTRNEREYKRFIQQMTDARKFYSGSHMIVEHPGGRDAHDDYVFSSALACWGAQGEGVDKPVTEQNIIRDTLKGRTQFYRTRNAITARRR